jgi:hypothetical protein
VGLCKGTSVQQAIDSFLWGYVKEQVFVPSVSLDIDELKLAITAAVEAIDRNMLERAWDELDFWRSH